MQVLTNKVRNGTMEEYLRSEENLTVPIDEDQLCSSNEMNLNVLIRFDNDNMILNALQEGKLLLERYTEMNWFHNMKTTGVSRASFSTTHEKSGASIWSFNCGKRTIVEILDFRKDVAPRYFLNKISRVTLLNRDVRTD